MDMTEAFNTLQKNVNAPMSTVAESAAETPRSGQSGSRPYTIADRSPSMMPLSGFAAIQRRHRSGTFAIG